MNKDEILKTDISSACERALAWFASMQAPEMPKGVSRISAAHKPKDFPGMLLSGSYNALMGRALLGDVPNSLLQAEREALTAWFLSFRLPDGRFRNPQMNDTNIYKKDDLQETWGYIDFHITNYSLGALEFIAPDLIPKLDFVLPWLDLKNLNAWLALRDLRDPWLEGNNIVNLSSFLLLLQKQQPKLPVSEAIHAILKWHYRLQEPATGFWGLGQAYDTTSALHAMAGSMHNFHLWYALNEKLPYQNKALDYALTQNPEIVSACIDVDLVDLMVHAQQMIAYRQKDTETWLRALLPHLLQWQNKDGGFPDTKEGIWRQDGWVKDGCYSEPQGISNSFATWFRLLAIAMISDHLWPNWKTWHFRNMIGIGYRQTP